MVDVARSFGGYGGKVDCYSALGLLGLLGLLEILRDLVSEVTEEGQRKKRSLPTLNNFYSVFDSFSTPLNLLKNEIVPGDITSSLPGVILPWLHVVADVNDAILSPSCLETIFCESNRHILQIEDDSWKKYTKFNATYKSKDIFGVKLATRKKVAQLLSETIAKAFIGVAPSLGFNEKLSSNSSDKDNRKDFYVEALEAAEAGRERKNCLILYPECNLSGPYKLGSYNFS
ncbi:UNVERIFIED_CONTAM: hypothetical protein RMT77_008237 [Armadillidium vulgare]